MNKVFKKVLFVGTVMLTATISLPLHAETTAPIMDSKKTSVVKSSQSTPAQKMFGDISPKLAELTDDVLYGDVWERPGLSKRDRSLVTISALIAMNRPDQLRSHIARARDNGVTQEEVIESITHLAFYSGWPSAVSAIAIAKEVFHGNPVNTSSK